MKNKFKMTNSHGFSLVELLLVVAIMAIIASVGGDILLSVVRSYKKSQILGEVEQNGTRASSVLENYLRTASEILDCTSGSCVAVTTGDTVHTNDISVIRSDNAQTERISWVSGSVSPPCSNGYLAINGVAVTNDDRLNGVDIIKVPGSAVVFTIYQPVNSAAVVTMLFRVQNSCAETVTAGADFNTTMTLRGGYGGK